MLNVRQAGDHLFGKLLAVADDVHGGDFLYRPFSREISWMRPGT